MELQKKEKKHKEKRRSNEKRKERSRDAARCRRSRETDIFTELAGALPIPTEQANHLDKASVMRLAIAYLKVRAVIDSIPGQVTKNESSIEMDQMCPKALNGFMLVISSDGNMVYLSENVSDYLGVSQMDMMGQSVYEYSHPCDHEELRECLEAKPNGDNEKGIYSFFLRLKCTLTSKGRKVNLKSASYKVIHCTGRLVSVHDSNANNMEVEDQEKSSDDECVERSLGVSLVLVGCPIPHPSNIEIPLGRDTFLSKHSLNMKFTYADEKLAEYLGWNNEELVGQSVFDFYHALDNTALDKCFKSLFSKGQCETVAYRFLGKRGGYAWVVTQATLIHCSKQHKPLSVVCVNYILSDVERVDEVFSVRQLAARESVGILKNTEETSVTVPLTLETIPEIEVKVFVEGEEAKREEDQLPGLVVAQRPRRTSLQESKEQEKTLLQVKETKPQAVTASVFHRSKQEATREKKEVEDTKICQEDGSRKGYSFPRPIQIDDISFVGVESLKESLEESLKHSAKENNEPSENRVDRKQEGVSNRSEFVFQGKPALEFDSETTGRRDRPLTVTRHLFTPLASINQQQIPQDQLACRPPPQTATASIFAPRTKDMNKGFLTFSEDQPGLTMLKDEPEDLTHLAPTPGDVCVPLEDTPFLSEMLDEFILGNDNYCPLLSPDGTLTPEIRATELGESLKNTDLDDQGKGVDSLVDPLANSDPFMYGDSPTSPCSIDPTSVSSSLSQYRQSPERSIDSLSSPTGGSSGDTLSEDEMLMLGINDSIGDEELALRAPYIPMSDQDEALELLISDDMVMWGPTQLSEKASSKWLADEREERRTDSSLAQLLRTDQIVARRYNDHGGGLVNPAQVLGQIPRKNMSLGMSNHWSIKTDRATERPNKRIHAATTADSLNDKKRIKCEDFSAPERNGLLCEEHLLREKHSSSRGTSTIAGSQLLRRLVTQHTAAMMPRKKYLNDMEREQSYRMQNLTNESEEEDGDGGGGGGGNERRNFENLVADVAGRIHNPSSSKHRSSACNNSVLMNLLVSGCDDTRVDSRSVPLLLQKNATTALSVELDNQMVPECNHVDTNDISLDHMKSNIGRQLTDSLLCGPGSSIVSPPANNPMTNFESFDYNCAGGTGTSGLLHLFGGLLDRNLV